MYCGWKACIAFVALCVGPCDRPMMAPWKAGGGNAVCTAVRADARAQKRATHSCKGVRLMAGKQNGKPHNGKQAAAADDAKSKDLERDRVRPQNEALRTNQG